MELRELSDRLLRRHARLIIGMILAGVLAALGLQVRDQPAYQASTLLVLGAQDPQSTSAAVALADAARGIATGPQLVARAISQTGAHRNVVEVSKAVNVQTIGSSGVLDLTVTDPDPLVSVKLANALAAGVVRTRAIIENGLTSSLRQLDLQAAATAAEIQKLDSRINALTTQIATRSGTGGPNPLALKLNVLQASRTALQDQATQITVQRNELQGQAGPTATVIDKAVSAVGTSSRAPLDVVLGAMLGLVLGLAAAAVLEALWPSLVGAAAISRATGVPLLGQMSTPPDRWTLATLPDSGSYVELAADAQHVHDVRFAALDPQGRRSARVRMLEGPLGRLKFGAAQDGEVRNEATRDAATRDGQARAWRTAAAKDTPSDSPGTGLVVAVPRVLKLAHVEALTNFIWISGWTLLGVIVYPPLKKRPKTAQSPPGATGSQQQTAADAPAEVDA